ncbi:hypothetical protein Tco_1398248 [Tanacetum coccineum]
MELIHPTIADLSRASAKYQVDQTQSTKLRYQSLTENKGKPSHEGELDTLPLVLSTYVDVRAFLLTNDEGQESKEDMVGAAIEASNTNSSSDDILKKYENILPLTERQLEKHGVAAVNYADLKASIDDYYDKNIAHRDQTDKLVEASMSSLDKSNNTISDLYKGLNIITKLLKEIKNAIKDDSVIKKIYEELAAWAKSSTNIAWNLSSRLSGLERAQNHIQSSMSSLKEDTHFIKTMMSEMYDVFKGQSSSSVTPTLVLTYILANIKRENATNTTTEKPPSYIEGETEHPKIAVLISSIQPTELDEDPLKKLVPASTIVRPDPDEDVKVPYMINGKMCYLTDKEMQAYLDREEKLKKAAEEEILLAISKPEVIKVVQEEAEKIGLNPKKLQVPKQFEYGIFFTDEFGDQAFQIWSNIEKVGMEALVSYLVAVSMVKSPENARFNMKLRKLIAEHPDQEKLKSKKVKLEALGYEMN